MVDTHSTCTGPLNRDQRTHCVRASIVESTQLRDVVAAFFRNNDIAVYDGHGAIVRGLIVNHGMPIAAADFATFGLSPTRKQLFAFLGCRTYSVFGDGFYAAAGKNSDALDARRIRS